MHERREVGPESMPPCAGQQTARAPACHRETRSSNKAKNDKSHSVIEIVGEPKKRKRQEPRKRLYIEVAGVKHTSVPVNLPEIPPSLIAWLQRIKGTTMPTQQVAYLKKMPGSGIGAFAFRDLEENTLIDIYNGELLDLEVGQTLWTSRPEFGRFLHSLRLLGAVKGNGYEYVDGSEHTGKDGTKHDMEWFLREGTASFFNGCRRYSPLHNVKVVVWPVSLDNVSTWASGIGSA